MAIEKWLKDKWDTVKIAFISSFIWGLLAHGMTIFNKYSLHDDPKFLFGVGNTLDLGRWGLEILKNLEVMLWGGESSNFSFPLINGVLTLLFVTAISAMIIDYFEFNKPFENILITGILVTYPTITGLLGFAFTAHFYSFGLMVGVFAILYYSKKPNVFRLIVSGILTSFAVGTYQANIPFLVSVLLLDLIMKTVNGDGNIKEFIINAGKSIILCACFMGLYFIINKIFLSLSGSQLSEYKDVGSFGLTSIGGYIDRFKDAYKEFYSPTVLFSGNMYPLRIRSLYQLFVISGTIIAGLFIYNNCNGTILKAAELTIEVAMIPLFTNLILFMITKSEIHGLMTYGGAMSFVFAIYFIKKTPLPKATVILQAVVVVLTLMIVLSYVRFANLCYLKMDLYQNELQSYYTTLVTRIKSTEGYDDSLKVCYIGEFDKSDESMVNHDEFNGIYLHPYKFSINKLLNDHSWRYFLWHWCGYNPEVIEEDQLNIGDYSQMPCYPDDGSIKVSDGIVIVKFAD